MASTVLSILAKEDFGKRESTELRRREILDSALACFLRSGVQGTTMKQIQSESGASSGSIYHLFRGKDEIAMTLFLEGMDVYHSVLEEAMENQTTARTCVKAIISAHIKNVVDDPALSSYLTRMGMANVSGEFSEPYQAHNDQFAETVWSNLKQFVDSGEIIRLPKNLYFPLIIGSTSFLCRTWLRNGQGKKELTSQSNVLVKTAWKSLQP